MKIFLSLTLVLLLAVAWVPPAEALTISNIDYEKQPNGFRVSIPDQEGISRILTVAKVDQQCPGLMDYITEPRNGSWSSSFEYRASKPPSNLEFNFMIEYRDEIYLKKMMVEANEFIVEPTLSREYLAEQKCNQVESLFVNCEASETTVKSNEAPVYCAGKKIFEDNFDGEQVDGRLWTRDVRILLYSENEELVAFTDSEQNSFVKNGLLHIRPTINENIRQESFAFGDRCSSRCKECGMCQIIRSSYTINPPVFSARLHTRNAFSFRYGRVEIRAKLPIGDWLFPYLLLEPKSRDLDDLYAKQVKIAAARGNSVLINRTNEEIGGRRLLGGTLIWPSEGEPLEFYQEKLASRHFGEDFHVYSLTWKSDGITLAVDGTVYGVITKNLHMFQEEMYLVVGVTVGGFWNFPDDQLPAKVKPYRNRDHRAALEFWKAKDAWSSTWTGDEQLQIDYIKVFSV